MNMADTMKKTVSFQDVSPEKLRPVGKNLQEMDAISRPSLSFMQDAWRRIRKNKVAFTCLLILGFYVLLAIFVPILSPYDSTTQSATLMNAKLSSEHWFGCDSLGRDLFVRVWEGGRVSLSIGFLAAFLNGLIGTCIGCFIGYYGGWVDTLMMRIVDILYGIPNLIVTMLVMLVLGRGVNCLIIAMVIVDWVGACRFARGEMMRLKNQDFVAAAKVLGVPTSSIIFRHILPNMLGLLITNLTMAVPSAIFKEAFLSFIGLGVAPPASSWGVLAKEGITALRTYPTQLFIPAFFICTTVLALNLLGDGLRDAFDPRLRGMD
jgi:oligopeptide transport system permease protein